MGLGVLINACTGLGGVGADGPARTRGAVSGQRIQSTNRQFWERAAAWAVGGREAGTGQLYRQGRVPALVEY